MLSGKCFFDNSSDRCRNDGRRPTSEFDGNIPSNQWLAIVLQSELILCLCLEHIVVLRFLVQIRFPILRETRERIGYNGGTWILNVGPFQEGKETSSVASYAFVRMFDVI